MKASELIKKSVKIEDIYSQIETSNENGNFKTSIPNTMYVDDGVVIQLVKNGFKVYRGSLYGNIPNELIIEW
jgi:hypothetical protein